MLSEKQAIPLRKFQSRLRQAEGERETHSDRKRRLFFSGIYQITLFIQTENLITVGWVLYARCSSFVLFSYTPNQVSYFAWIFYKVVFTPNAEFNFAGSHAIFFVRIFGNRFPAVCFIGTFLNSAIIAIRVVQNSNAVWWSASLAYGIFMNGTTEVCSGSRARRIKFHFIEKNKRQRGERGRGSARR